MSRSDPFSHFVAALAVAAVTGAIAHALFEAAGACSTEPSVLSLLFDGATAAALGYLAVDLLERAQPAAD